jgi:hypothetical protein
MKLKHCPATAMQRQGGEEVELLLILNLGTRWGEWSASRPCRALPPGKRTPVPIGREAELASELVWTQKLEETSFSSIRDRTPIDQYVVRHYTD